MKEYKLKYKGLNCTSFLNFIIKNEIKISSADLISNEVTFSIDSVNHKKLKSAKSPYKTKVVKNGGAKQLFSFLLRRIGIIVGVLIILVSHIAVGNQIMYISVLGSSNSEVVKQAVRDYGINYKNIKNLNTEELEKYLLDNVSNLSLVSVKTTGNAVVVNVMEKDDEDTEFGCFYAPYNMVIKEIELISGTLCVKKNDVLKKGAVLVEPYSIDSNGDRISVPAKAKITADVWFCGSETANKEISYYQRTLNKKVYSTMSNKLSDNTDFMSPYNTFESETINLNITNGYFLPIYIHKTIFYETEKIVEIFDFENNKNQFLEKSKQKAYDILPNNVIINKIVQNIAELEDRYIFQTYLKSTMEITNEN